MIDFLGRLGKLSLTGLIVACVAVGLIALLYILKFTIYVAIGVSIVVALAYFGVRWAGSLWTRLKTAVIGPQV